MTSGGSAKIAYLITGLIEKRKRTLKMSINDATPQDWDRVRATGEPTFEEYQKRLNFSWVHDGTKPAPQTAYKEDVDMFGSCWDVKKSTIDEQMKVYLDAAEEELDMALRETEWWKQRVARKEQAEYEARWVDESLEEIIARQDEEDVVNNPDHYNTGNVECIEAIEESMTPEAFRGYLKGNCMKYLWRYSYKGKPVEDLQKAQWYLAKLLQEELFEAEG
jgi:hypothetical protein